MPYTVRLVFKKTRHHYLPSDKEELTQRHAHFNSIKDDIIKRKCYCGRAEVKDIKLGEKTITICFYNKTFIQIIKNVIWDFKNLVIKIINFGMQFLTKSNARILYHSV